MFVNETLKTFLVFKFKGISVEEKKLWNINFSRDYGTKNGFVSFKLGLVVRGKIKPCLWYLKF
jgi:hypothetical protein